MFLSPNRENLIYILPNTGVKTLSSTTVTGSRPDKANFKANTRTWAQRAQHEAYTFPESIGFSTLYLISPTELLTKTEKKRGGFSILVWPARYFCQKNH